MANVNVFSKVGQRSWSRSHVENLWYHRKGFFSYGTPMPNMKAISLTVKKLYAMLKFADGQTDRQTYGQTDKWRQVAEP